MSDSSEEMIKYHVRILSPKGVYPEKSIILNGAGYISDPEISFIITHYEKNTGDSGHINESYSEVEWLNPSEAKIIACIMFAVDRDENYCSFYPHLSTETLNISTKNFNLEWIRNHVKPLLTATLVADTLKAKKSRYVSYADIELPPILGGTLYDFRSTGIDYTLAKELFNCINLDDSLLIRGITTYIKAEMLSKHHQFMESAIYSIFITLEVSFRLVLRTLKAQGVVNPSSEDAMKYIHDSFNDVFRAEKYFEDYYKNRVMSLHPESRYGIFSNAPLAVDDYFFLTRDMIEIYAFLICGYIHPKHKSKIIKTPAKLL